jgi:hypothetical protein
VFKVIWNPRYAPTALVLMLLSALDCKLYDKIYLGRCNALWHLIVILAPFFYFYYLGKHKRNITVNKTITIKQQPTEPIPQPRYQPQIEEPEKRKDINPPEFYARQANDEVRNAKTIDYIEID